ncbi:MAG TPA: HAMP domain-containing sensor histidine kinase [Thermoleophilaceae bacterium]|nr:HAMP domain-containing sensor histidine kinase [Thermoleophilaceae bacterium]
MPVTSGGLQTETRYSPLFWRVLALNAVVLVVACVVTVVIVTPRKVGSFAASEALVLAASLVLIAVANLLLLKRAFRPLERVTRLAREADPTRPGQRVPLDGDRSEAGQLAAVFNDMLERLEAERRHSARRALGAQERERLRVAQELHDEVGQTLTAVLLQLSQLGKGAPPELARATTEVQDSVRTSLEDVRRIARELRPEALDELGLGSALAALCDRLSQRAGLRIARRMDGDIPDLPEDVELVIYRIAQEALTNVVRHAGVGTAELELARTGDRLVLTVRDSGGSLPPGAGDGGGLRGMRERAVMVGADLRVINRPGGGVEVRLEVPLGDESAWYR